MRREGEEDEKEERGGKRRRKGRRRKRRRRRRRELVRGQSALLLASLTSLDEGKSPLSGQTCQLKDPKPCQWDSERTEWAKLVTPARREE